LTTTAAPTAPDRRFGKKAFLDLLVKIMAGWHNSPQVIKEIFE
jgi:hypothetical protein